jgi:hypothetical protein
VVHEPGSTLPDTTQALTGVATARLLLTLVPRLARMDGLSITVGGSAVPLLPAVPGTVPGTGIRYPVFADLPVAALRTDSNDQVHLGLNLPGGFADVVHADLELTPVPGATQERRDQRRQTSLPLRPLAAPPVAALRTAAGNPLPEGEAMPRGRAVLDVRLDGPGGQQSTGDLAPLAGIEVLLDGRLIATLPTDAEGPGVAGNWRFSIDMSRLAAGPHTIEARSVAVDPTIKEGASFTSFLVAA